MLGAQCAALPELFGSRHRYIGVAVCREFSAIIAGGIAPFVGALLLGWFNNSWIPLAVYVIVLTLITLYATFHTPGDPRPRPHPAHRRGGRHRHRHRRRGPRRWPTPTAPPTSRRPVAV